MFYIRKPNFKVEIDDYKEALFSSLKSEEWIRSAYTDEINMLEWLDKNNSIFNKKAINEYKKTKNITALFKAKSQVCLSELALEMIFHAGKASTNVKLVEMILNKTISNANTTKFLLHEYCEDTGDTFDGTITPFPQRIEDTIKPIDKFNIATNKNKLFKVTIKEKYLEINEGEDLEKLKSHFESRLKSKSIKKRYLKKSQLSETKYKNSIRDLINLKETVISCNHCHLISENCEYKILYRGNQTVSDETIEKTLLGNNLQILSITKIS